MREYQADRRRAADPKKYAIIRSAKAERNTWETRGLRQCRECGVILRATRDWFSEGPKCHLGITFECRSCANKRQAVYHNGSPLTPERYRKQKAERAALRAQGLKQCTSCKIVLPLDREHFHLDKRSLDGHRGSCRTCTAASRKEHPPRKYPPHKTACRAHYEEWCAQGCALCGDARWIGLIHAHHRDPKKKDFHIGKFSGRGAVMLPLMKRELSKCTPLCANCHALVGRESRNTDASVPFDDLLALVREKYPA